MLIHEVHDSIFLLLSFNKLRYNINAYKCMNLNQRHTMLVFLLDCFRFSKLLKLHQTEGIISNNVCRWL